jgi:flagellar basal body rod protein FlgB
VESDPPFESKYFKEYDELEDDPDTPVPPLNIHVRETTPQGDVIMTYDADRVVFCYYCDKRTVQFKYLESVARKYVVTHGCKRIYIDFRKELSKAEAAAEAKAAAKAIDTATKSTAKTTTTSSVFAQLKKYSMTSVPIINKNDKLLRANNANNANTNEERACVLKEQVTRYLYCGRLDDFIAVSEGSHATETHDFNIIKPIDYASYKKMNDA